MTSPFPVTISEPGSYRLTGNLKPAAGPVDIIEITTGEVVLDLNGFGQSTGDPANSNFLNNPNLVFLGTLLSPPVDEPEASKPPRW